MESEAHKLFVGGIVRDTIEEDLKQHFSGYGTVLGAVVPRVRGSGTPRCFGFVWFADSVAADRALQDTHIIRGRRVDVRKAIPKNEQPQVQQQQQSLYRNRSQENSAANGESSDTDRKIFVGGLPSSLTKEEFRSYFEQFGQITDAVVMYDKLTEQPRGFGFVTFDSEDSVEKVTQNSFHVLNNKNVEVKRAVRKEDIQNSVHNSFGYGRGYNCSNHVQYPLPVVGMHFQPLLPVYNGGFHDPSQAEIYLPDGSFLPGRHWDNHNTVMHGYGYFPAAYANNTGYGLNTNGLIYNPSYDLNTNGVIYNPSYPNVNYYVDGRSGGMNGRLDGQHMNTYGYTSGVWHPNGSILAPQVNGMGEMNAGINNSGSARTTNGEICDLETEPRKEGNKNVQNSERNPIADNAAEDNVNKTHRNENGHVDVLSSQVNGLKLADEETKSQTSSDGHDQRSP